MLNNPMQLIGMLQNSNNPMAMIQQILGSNPQFKQVMGIVHGKNPMQLEQYVRNLAKGQNIDINQLANQFGLKIN
jgi:hypothetical protein